MYTTIRHELRQAKKALPGTLVDQCLLFGFRYTAQSSFVSSIVLQYVKAAVLLLSLLTFFFSFFLFSSYKNMSTVFSNAHININHFYANNPMAPIVSILCISFSII
jgi:hypothetical protein